MSENRVIVVGAGPVGLLTALVLAKREIQVLVLEAEPGLTVDLRAGTYHPPSLEMMAPYGITDDMHRTGIKVPRWQIRDKDEGVIVEWDLSLLADTTPYPYRLHLEQHRLTPIIFDKLRAHPNVEVRFNAPVTEVTQDADGVRVCAGDATHTGAFCVGADGGRSTVRKAMGVEFEGFTWPERFAVISTDFDFQPLGYAFNAYIAHPVEWSAIFKMPDVGPPGIWRVVFPVGPDESDEAALDPDRAEWRMQRFHRRDVPYTVKYKSIYRVHQRVASDFRRGRILIAGDAAHVNNPLGAFGLNGGIHDAINLGDKLGRVMCGEGGVDASLLDLYTRQRRTANIEQVQANSIQNKKRLETNDPEAKQRNWDELRRIAADPKQAREFLIVSSMIRSVQRAAGVA